MTYKELYEKALWDLEHGKINLGEFEDMIEPLNKEIPNESEDNMDDKVQIKLLSDAIVAYENGEILEAKDMAIEFINNITDFEAESEVEENGRYRIGD